MGKSLNDFNHGKFIEGILSSDRIILSRAITLIESKKDEHRRFADQIIEEILPHSGKSLRIGITGVPGVGKSTFIESFGQLITSLGKKLAVLSIDPSSSLSKGSILGDKTRMERLANNKNAYIRPSPSGAKLGGVAQKTRETMLLCEAAGFDVIIVETVGVGQSETAVKDMVDYFLLLMLSGGGDELQGIKRGIMEMADAVAINKVDGNTIKEGKRAAKAYSNALHLFPPGKNQWTVPVHIVSSIENTGIEEVWEKLGEFVENTRKNGFFEKNRKEQNLKWFKEALRVKLEEDFYNSPAKSLLRDMESKISSGEISVRKAINELIPD